MAAFGKASFNHSSYAAVRPTYPDHLYGMILKFHKGGKNLLIDLGSGHGLIARALSKYFKKVFGTDPSGGMIEQAKSLTNPAEYPNVEYKSTSAESLTFVADQTVDMVVAGQAAHWFHYPTLFPELKRVVKSNGTLAFWGYKDHVYVDYPKATKILSDFAYETHDKDALGPYWQQPGRSIVQSSLRAIQPPEDEWEVERVEYEPDTSGRKSGKGTLFVESRMTLAQSMDYIRTWSAFHGWQEAHPDRKKRSAGGEGDCVDDIFDKMVQEEDDWKSEPNWQQKEVNVEWGFGLLMARRKQHFLE